MIMPRAFRTYQSSILFVLLVMYAQQAAWSENTCLEIWSAYTQPDHVGRVVFRNCGGDALALENVSLTAKDGHALSPLWVTIEPRSVLPGETTMISWLMSLENSDVQNPKIPVPFSELVLQINDQDFALTHPTPKLVMDYAVRDDDGQVYLYFTGSKDGLPAITQCYLDDAALEALNIIQAPEAGSVLVMGRTNAFQTAEPEVPLIRVRLVSEINEEIHLFARLFHTHHTLFRFSGSTMGKHLMVGSCLTHNEESFQKAAEKTVTSAAEHWGRIRTIKVCNIDLGQNGPFYFAALAEQNHIESQLTFPTECRNGDYIRALLNCAENTREWSTPGIFFSWIFPEDIHFEDIPSYSFPKLRAMVYANLAGGSRGLEFQRSHRDDPDGQIMRNYTRLQQEVAQLQPLLALAEPMDLVATAPPDSHVRTLLCGDQGILVFLLSRNSQTPLETKEETLTLYAPQGIEFSSQAIEIGGAATIQEVTMDDNLLSFTCKPDLATVYFIPGSLKGNNDSR
jgi:hypothetical protein